MANNEHPLSLVIRAVDKATGPLKKVAEQIQKVSGGTVLKNFGSLGKEFVGFGKAVASTAVKLGALTAGASFGLYKIVRAATDAGDKLGEMAQRVGLGVDSYASLQFAAAQADVEQEEFNAAMDKFNVSLGQAKAGGGPLLSFLKQVSPALATQIRNAKGTTEAFALMTRAMEKVEDPSKRAALAQAAFGKTGKQFGQFLGQGTKAIEEQRKQYLALAGSQEEFARRAGILDNTLRPLGAQFEGIKNRMVTALMPAFGRLAELLGDFLAKHGDALVAWAERANGTFQAWVNSGGFDELVKDIKETAKTISDLIERAGGLKTVIMAVAAVLAGPMVSSTASVGAEIAKLGFNMLSLLANQSGFTAWALGWIKYLWMMRTVIMGSLIPSFTALWASIAPFLVAAAPFIAIAAAIAAVGTAIYQVYKHWDELKASGFSDLWAWAKNLVGIEETDEEAMRRMNRPTAAAPVARAAVPLPAPPVSRSDIRAQLDFSNVPRGTKVSTSASGPASLDTSVGYSMGVP